MGMIEESPYFRIWLDLGDYELARLSLWAAAMLVLVIRIFINDHIISKYKKRLTTLAKKVKVMNADMANIHTWMQDLYEYLQDEEEK